MLNTIIKECPNLQITIGAQELKAFAFTLLDEFARMKEKEKNEAAKVETYLSTNQVCEMLGVNRSTLWRWEKSGYLVPQYAGNRCRYTQSAINKILEERK